MLCPRCQSDNKPGRNTCWNCLSPLDGALAQRFAQKPPDVAASSAAAAPGKKQGQGFWIGILAFSFGVLVAALVAFWYMSTSLAGTLTDEARQHAPQPQQQAPAPADNSSSNNSSSSSSSSDSAKPAGGKSDDSGGGGGLGGRNKALAGSD